MKTETIWMRLASFIVKLPKYYTMVHIFYESFIKLKFQITNILFNHLIWYDHLSSEPVRIQLRNLLSTVLNLDRKDKNNEKVAGNGPNFKN